MRGSPEYFLGARRNGNMTGINNIKGESFSLNCANIN